MFSGYFAEVTRTTFCGFCTTTFAERHSSGIFLFSHAASLEQAVAVERQTFQGRTE
jgi:hypothetical protein